MTYPNASPNRVEVLEYSKSKSTRVCKDSSWKVDWTVLIILLTYRIAFRYVRNSSIKSWSMITSTVKLNGGMQIKTMSKIRFHLF